MIKEKTKKPGDRRLLLAVVAGVLVILTALYVTLELLINAGLLSFGQNPGEGGVKKPIKDGEAYYGSARVAYPTFDRANIQFVDIDIVPEDENDDRGSFSMLRPSKNEEFILYYEDEDGSTVPYVPPIVGAEGSFDYSQLFAFDTSSGLNVPKISYLCVALGILYFNERIELEDDTRAAQLERYGLDEGSYNKVTVSYLDADGKEKAHTVKIGDALLTGSGYYYMVDDRDCVYTSLGNGFDYALSGFESFLHSRVVASGLSGDGAYEPYLTTSYKQWKHTVHDAVGEIIERDSEIVVSGKRLDPSYDSKGGSSDGYLYQTYDKLSMDLAVLSEREEYGRIVEILASTAVGDYSDNPLLLTVLADRCEVSLTDGQSGEYTYEIVAVESVITDSGEFSTDGYAVGGADLVRVTYNYSVDGTRVNVSPCHGVFDISDDGAAPEDVKEKLRAACVGALSVPITYQKTYNEENSESSVYEYVITDIAAIYDKDYKVAAKIDENSKVNYYYVFRVNGKQVGAEMQATVDLAAITSGEDLTIKNKLLGRGVGADLNLVVSSDTRYGQDVYRFITYEIDEVKYFVDKEIITSFKFINAVDRDPFFGESLYKNTLENENKSYALNSEVCEAVVKTLGGIVSSSNGSPQSNSAAVGLLGSETVAVGLTPSNMEKYGLYANTVYFELPRGIKTSEDLSSGKTEYTDIDSYTYLSTLGFYLYVSDEQPDGTRYVGSDMYDIVVKMDGSVFDFVEHSFVEYWARRSLVMVNYEYIDYIDLEFSMSDLYGNYHFDLDHKDIYLNSSGEVSDSGTRFDKVTVNVTPSGECTDNALLKWLLADQTAHPSLDITSIKLETVYDRESDKGDAGEFGNDRAGTAYFKEQLRLLFSIYYTGSLTEEEQAEALLSSEKLMSITFKVDTSRAGPASSPYPYVYDFYRLSDRRVMVVIREVGPNGETMSQVSDFYISQFAFKKIAYNFVNLLNGVPIDTSGGY